MTPVYAIVDNDTTVLDEMQLIYPPHWLYRTQDYENFLDSALATGESYDFDRRRLMESYVHRGRLGSLAKADAAMLRYTDHQLFGRPCRTRRWHRTTSMA